MRLLLLLVVPACLSRQPCEPDHLDDDSNAGPGEVVHGVALDSQHTVVMTGTTRGVACLACNSIRYFDDTLHDQRVAVPRLVGVPALARMAASGDTTFVLDRDLGRDYSSEPYRPHHFELFALSGSGQEVWRVDLGAGDDGTPSDVAAGPASVVVYSVPGYPRAYAHVYDPATGALRYSTTGSFRVVAPDATGGLFTADGLLPEAQPAHVTVQHLDASGTQTWTATWTAENPPPPTRYPAGPYAIAPTADGGVVIAVYDEGRTLDLGDRVLEGPSPTRNTFLIALAGDGTVQWTFAIGRIFKTLMMAPTPDGVVLGGTNSPGESLLPAFYADSFVARVQRSGSIFAYPIAGSGVQTVYAVTAGAPGTATALVWNRSTEGLPAAMQVGDRTFDDGQGYRPYLLNISL